MARDGCTGKVRHPDKTSACIAARRMKSAAMDVYQCRKCAGWHIGNSRKPNRVQKRIDQILQRTDRDAARRAAQYRAAAYVEERKG